jgi:hypothetical protein
MSAPLVQNAPTLQVWQVAIEVALVAVDQLPGAHVEIAAPPVQYWPLVHAAHVETELSPVVVLHVPAVQLIALLIPSGQ